MRNIKREVTDFLVQNYKQRMTISENQPLDIDSLDKIEVAMWAEKEYGIEIYDEELFAWTFLSDIVNCIENKTKQS